MQAGDVAGRLALGPLAVIRRTDYEGRALMSEFTPTLEREEPVKPLSPLYRHARYVFGFYVGVQALFALFLLVMALIFYRATNGSYISQALADGLDLIGLLVGLSYFVVLIWSIVLVLRFTYRAMKNLRLLGEQTDISPSMAVVWYFVPFALFYFPFKGMREIWLRSRKRAGLEDESSGHLGGWWVTWIVGGLLGNLTLRLVGFGDDASLEMLAFTNVIDATGSLIHIVSALFLLRILGEIASAQGQEVQ
jgi:hypothetical protein